jgi:hypothetical protein
VALDVEMIWALTVMVDKLTGSSRAADQYLTDFSIGGRWLIGSQRGVSAENYKQRRNVQGAP